jgi:hypothetical protein
MEDVETYMMGGGEREVTRYQVSQFNEFFKSLTLIDVNLTQPLGANPNLE